MGTVESKREYSHSLNAPAAGTSLVRRLNIHQRLVVCFILLIVLMLAGNAILLWQLHLIRIQGERLNAVDQEFIEVLHVHANLASFHVRLVGLARSEDADRLLRESDTLRSMLAQDAERTQMVFKHLPPGVRLDPTVLASLETIQSALPSHLDAIRALVISRDWEAVRLRLERQVQPLEVLSSEIVQNVDHDVARQRAEAAVNIERGERRMFLIVPLTALLSLIIAGVLGIGITRSITEPLDRLMEGSGALARGNFQHRVRIRGNDELTHLSRIFNETTDKLQRVYETLRDREAYLARAQRLSQTGSFGWSVSGSQLFWSDETFRIFEYDPATNVPALDLMFERVHPDDAASVRRLFDGASQDGQDFDLAFRLVMPDRSLKHVHLVAHGAKNDASELEFVGAVMDVTSTTKAFQEIQFLKDQLYKENIALREEVDKVSMFEEIVGSSEALRKVLGQVTRVGPTDSTVLILGETGTGKEMIARAIHRRSSRSARAFIRVNCAAIPPTLIASELFGHEKGAFTGAAQRRLGRFELANGGTIFLDEIGELPPETQIALLRVLQEREFERVGGTQSVSVDVRILSATNRDLKAAVQAGAFREDLFYRLNVFPIHVPSLRERADDIPLLIEYLIERYAKKAGKRIKKIDKATMELFQAYKWPGNVRELQNVVERAVILCDGDTFSVDETWFKRDSRIETVRVEVSGKKLGRLHPEEEKQIIEAVLAGCAGRISGPKGAAAQLGIPRQTLESKIASLGINKHKFKST